MAAVLVLGVEPTAAAFSLDGVSKSWNRSEAEVEAMRGRVGVSQQNLIRIEHQINGQDNVPIGKLDVRRPY